MHHNKVSLIIPVKDEEDSITSLLESLRKQTRTPDEIVITDGGSTDKTAEIIESYINSGSPIRLIKSSAAYPGKGRNIAIEASSNEWIAMTDAGIHLDKDWFKELVRPIDDDCDFDIVYGNYQPVTDSFFKECLALAFVKAPHKVNGKKARSHSTASCLIRKSVWKAVGGFPDLRAAEDRIFMERVERAGFKTGFAPDATVYWNIPKDFIATFRRFSNLSMHDLRAGRFMDWHFAVMRMYAGGLILIVLGILFSPLCFILLVGAILARSIWLINGRAQEVSFFNKFNPIRVALVTILIIWIDIAMFWGMGQYLFYRLAGRRA